MGMDVHAVPIETAKDALEPVSTLQELETSDRCQLGQGVGIDSSGVKTNDRRQLEEEVHPRR